MKRSRSESVAQITGLLEGGGWCLTEEPSPAEAGGCSREEWIHVRLFLCSHWGKKKVALESGLLELEETTFHKRFERDQSKVASGPCFPLPAECNWSSLHGEGTTTCGDHDTCLSCTWLIHLVFCIFQVNDLSLIPVKVSPNSQAHCLQVENCVFLQVLEMKFLSF